MGAIKYSPAAPIIVRVNHGERSSPCSPTCPLPTQPRHGHGAPAVPVPGPDERPAPAWIPQPGPTFPPLALGVTHRLGGSRGGEHADGTANAFACPSILTAAQGRAASTLRVEGTRATGSRSGRQRGGLTCPPQLAPPSVTWRPRGDLCHHLAFRSHSPLIGVLRPCQGLAGQPLPACCLRCHTRAPASLLFVQVGTTALSLRLPPRPAVRASVLPSLLTHGSHCPSPSPPSDLRLKARRGQGMTNLLTKQHSTPKLTCQIPFYLLTHNYM